MSDIDATEAEISAMRERINALSPLWTAGEWNKLTARWQELIKKVDLRGGEVEQSLEVDPPAKVIELAVAERELGSPLPESLLRAMLVSKSVRMSWLFPEGAPAERGGYDEAVWNLADVPALYEESRAWAIDEDDEQDRLWVEAIPFAGIDGSYLAIHGERVVFLEHEGDPLGGHEACLAPDFRSFVENWTLCGCPNAGDWDQLKKFISSDAIGPSSPGGKEFQGWLEK